MIVDKIRGYKEYVQYLDKIKKERERRIALEYCLSDLAKQFIKENKNKTYTHLGFCEVCNLPSTFHMDFLYSDGAVINFREHLCCDRCLLASRQRFMLSYIFDQVEERKQSVDVPTVYLYEQVTQFYKKAVQVLDAELVGSEFCGEDKFPGEVVNGVRHEDAQKLSFEENTFDFLVSNDVFEHVFDIELTLQEAHRVLKPNGKLFFTVPFYSMSEKTVNRAELKDNKIIHLCPPVYHGNPMSAEGALAVNDFGWDLFDSIKSAGFSDAYLMCYYSYEYGYMGYGLQLAIGAEK